MKNLRNYIARFFTLLVALQVLNMGLFVQDFETFQSHAVLNDENIINNLFEYVSEVVLDQVNAMPEYGNSEANKDLQAFKYSSIKLAEVKSVQMITWLGKPIERSYLPYNRFYNSDFIKEINPPPPKSLV